MANFLEEIVGKKKAGLAAAKADVSVEALREKALACKASHHFFKALSKAGGPKIIAEIKKASPSKGVIREGFDPEAITREYSAAGAAAISVLTEENYFQGSVEYLDIVKAATSLPVLRKDFLTEEYQLYEARFHGADAVLLIASLLSVNEITSMLLSAYQLGMDCLVEVHNEEDLKNVLLTPARIIGINNRNLTTFKVNLETAKTLSKSVPDDRIIVVESGIETYSDIKTYMDMGINCFLIGEAFMKSNDIKAKFKELITLPSPALRASSPARGEGKCE